MKLEKNCVARNEKNIVTKLDYNGTIIEFEQRKLTVGEVNTYEKSTDSIYNDKDVFAALIKESEVVNSNKKIVGIYKKKYDILMLKELEEDDKIEQLAKLEDEYKGSITKLDIDTEFLVGQASEMMEDKAFELDVKLIKYSITPSKYNGGYVKEDGVVKLEDDIDNILKELEVEDFNELKANTIKLMHPTENDIEDAK